jgi:hypothetical protein
MFKQKPGLTWTVIVFSLVGAFLALYVAITGRIAGRGLDIAYVILGVSLVVVSVASVIRMCRP